MSWETFLKVNQARLYIASQWRLVASDVDYRRAVLLSATSRGSAENTRALTGLIIQKSPKALWQ